MYSKIFESKKIRIRNDHYKKLLERFDKNNFKRETVETCGILYTILENNVPCALCDAFFKNMSDCSTCPLAVLVDACDDNGCAYIMRRLLPPVRMQHLLICRNRVAYLPAYAIEALKELEAIFNFLKSFKKE